MLGLFLSILWKTVNAQEKKHSERYMDVYKKYLDATCPIRKDSIQHFVYFVRDRESIQVHPFLSHSMFKGAQIMYSWRQLEPEKGKYDFSILEQDYEYLKEFKKKLFVTLQDVTFNTKYKAVSAINLYRLKRQNVTVTLCLSVKTSKK
jgi:hypothetical protein